MVEVTHEGNWTVLRLTGAIDIVSAPHLRQIVQELQSQGHDRLRFDLSTVEFMDSQGLNLLTAARRAAMAMGGEVVVTGVSAELRRLFDISGLQLLLEQGGSGDEEPPAPPNNFVA